MKAKNLVMLAIVAGVAIFFALNSNKTTKTPAQEMAGKKLFVDFPVNDVAKIIIYDGSKKTILSRESGRWSAPEKFNYPIKFDAISQTLISLANIRIADKRNLSDDQKKELKLLTPEKAETPDQSGALTTFLDGEGKVIAKLLVGNQRVSSPADDSFRSSIPSGSYVSTDDGETIYITASPIDSLSPDINTWLHQDIVSVSAFEITNFNLAVSGQKPLNLYRKDNALTMDGLSKKEELDQTTASSVQYALSYLRFDDVADPALDEKACGMDAPSIFTVTTADEERYTIKIGAYPDDTNNYFVKCEAELLVKTDAEDENDTEKQKERKDLEKKIDDINARVGNWTYIIAAHKAKPMLATRDKLVRKKEKKK